MEFHRDDDHLGAKQSWVVHTFCRTWKCNTLIGHPFLERSVKWRIQNFHCGRLCQKNTYIITAFPWTTANAAEASSPACTHQRLSLTVLSSRIPFSSCLAFIPRGDPGTPNFLKQNLPYACLDSVQLRHPALLIHFPVFLPFS